MILGVGGCGSWDWECNFSVLDFELGFDFWLIDFDARVRNQNGFCGCGIWCYGLRFGKLNVGEISFWVSGAAHGWQFVVFNLGISVFVVSVNGMACWVVLGGGSVCVVLLGWFMTSLVCL
ncbi:hypothetical protein E2542_SST28621 [Spatholobus suberectus]|nr:hypothetical protein E2542_SST28621 [Spatholobus suberectus]